MATHVLCSVIWVGGLFFSYLVLRPSLSSVEGPIRLQIWAGVFRRFFPWVWCCVLLLFGSGFILVSSVFGGWANTPAYVVLMAAVAMLMLVLFAYLYFYPYQEFRAALSREDSAAAAMAVNRIRQIVLANLVLGVFVVSVAAALPL